VGVAEAFHVLLGKDVALLPNECIWQIPQQLLQQEVGRCEAHSRQVR